MTVPYTLCGLLVAAALLACGGEARSPSAARVVARDTMVIDGATPTCDCTLEAVGPVRIGTTTDRDIPQRVPDIIRDSRGTTYLVFHGWGNKPILRYDSTGRYLGKLGGFGQGPGEYSMTFRAYIGPGDSVFVFAEGRLQVYAPDGSYARVVAIPFAWPYAGSGDGTIHITRGNRWMRDTTMKANYAITLNPRGAPRDSFPMFSPRTGRFATSRSGTQVTRREVRVDITPALGPDGSVWGLTDGHYRLERYSPDGVSRQVIGVALPEIGPPVMTSRQADSTIAAGGFVDSKIPSYMRHPTHGKGYTIPAMAHSVDRDGRLWVTRVIPAPRWDTITVRTERLSPDEAPTEETVPRDTEDRLYHTIVEVIDPKRGQLIARHELPFLGLPVSPGFIGRVTMDELGHYVTSVYELRLRGG